VRPTPWTYALGALALAGLAVMYVVAFVLGAEPLPLGVVALAALLFGVGAVVGLRESLPLVRPRVRDVVAGAAAAGMSLFLTRGMGIPALVAVSLVAIVLGVMASRQGFLDRTSQGAGYAGAFVGLLAPTVAVHSAWAVLAGAVAGLFWSFIGPCVFPGVGGRLGLVAFMASAGIYLIADALGHDAGAVLVPQVDGLAHMAMVPIAAAGAVVTWVLIQRAGWDFALASGLTSLAVCGVIDLSIATDLAPVLGTAWFGGTMVGLSLPDRLPHPGWVLLAGLVYGAFMLHFEGPLSGHVGVIGATATIGVFVSMGVLWLSQLAVRRRAADPVSAPT